MTTVVAAFPGTGKTYFSKTVAPKKYPSRIVLDSDSSKYSWVKPGERNPDFPHNYIDSIKESTYHGANLILVSTHLEVRQALFDSKIPFTSLFPRRELKNEYIERFRKRDSDDTFIQLLQEKWDEFIDSMENKDMRSNGHRWIQLGSDVYLSECISFSPIESDDSVFWCGNPLEKTRIIGP